MDKESIFRLGLSHINKIDYDSSNEIYDPATNNHIINIKLNKEKEITCPHCGLIESHKIISSCKTKMKHASAIENNIILIINRRIFQCECGKYFRENNPFKNSPTKLTPQKEIKILDSLRDINKSFKDVAIEYDVSINTVQYIFDSRGAAKRLQFNDVLCVDEVYSKHCGFHKYCFITYSPQLDKILDVLPSRNKEDLLGYFSNIPLSERNKVKYFSMDLYAVYKQVAILCFPNALICADHFHVIKNLTDNFNKARIRIMKKYENNYSKDSWYWLYKKFWKLLLRNPEKLGYKKFKVCRSGMYLDEHQIVERILTIDEELRAGYELLCEYKAFDSIATPQNAAAILDDLIMKYHLSQLPEDYKSYKLLKKWHDEIVNSFNKVNGHKISNGGMERANRDIKTIIRHAYGYKVFRRFRNRIMYVKNSNSLIK